jgi:hypothetical protein
MTDRRALLTEREREIVAGDADVSDSYRYQTISRVRARFDRLEEDLAAMEQHGDLAAEFRATVCGGESARETGENADEDTGDQSDPTTADTDTSADTRAQADVVDQVAEAEGWTDDARLEDRKAAARGVLEYAREHGTISKQEAIDEVYPEFPVDGQNSRTWYRTTIRPVLNVAAEYDSGKWGYRLVEDGR